MNPADGEMYIGTLDQALKTFMERTAGKLLLLSDGGAYGPLAPHALSPRALFLVLDGDDALPLFALPDGIGGIAAAGGATVMRAARLFAEIRNLPCLLAPASAMLDGVYDAAPVKVDGVMRTLPLREGRVVLDERLYRASIARAAARLSLARLALLEGRALAVLCGGEGGGERAERAYAVLSSDDSVLMQNARLRRLECEGLPRGEGVLLAERMRTEHAERSAFLALSALYTAFFRCGKPRRYLTPDYRARAARANVPYADLVLPTPEQYARRAVALERVRAEFAEELSRIKRADSCNLVYCTEPFDAERVRPFLWTLPECGGGLTAVIRDFGLLEEL